MTDDKKLREFWLDKMDDIYFVDRRDAVKGIRSTSDIIHVIEYSAYEAEVKETAIFAANCGREQARLEAEIARLEAEKVSHAAQIAKDLFKLQDKIKALEAERDHWVNRAQSKDELWSKENLEKLEIKKERDELKAELEQNHKWNKENLDSHNKDRDKLEELRTHADKLAATLMNIRNEIKGQPGIWYKADAALAEHEKFKGEK